MSNIEQKAHIDRRLLNEEFYLQSLLEEAYKLQILSETEIEKIHLGCLELLAYKTERYNSGDSSSIQIEMAETIMKSNLYTIGIALKSFTTPDDAVVVLREEKISDLYDNGRKRIETKIKASKHLYALTLKNKFKTDNYIYNATIVDGIKGFFKLYNPDYEAHEIHITADYPLYNPVTNLAGIEFIQDYINAVRLENMFCGYFQADEIYHMLSGYDKNNKELVFNIFEQILTNALGCVVLGEATKSIIISDVNMKRLETVFYEKSKEQINNIIEQALQNLYLQLNINREALQNYIKKGLPKIIGNIYCAVQNNTMQNVFIQPKYPENDPKIVMSFSNKMDDESYRDLVDEIIKCRYSNDKISLIMRSIKSYGDLNDILRDGELTESEMITIFKQLSPYEIAALAKHNPHKEDYDFVDMSEVEIKLAKTIHSFVDEQTDEYRKRFKQIIEYLIIE